MAAEAEWKKTFEAWKKANPELSVRFDATQHRKMPKDLEELLWNVEIKSPIAGIYLKGPCLPYENGAQSAFRLIPKRVGAHTLGRPCR